MIQELKIENEKTNKAVASLSNELILLKKSYSDIVKRLAELEKLKSHTVPTNNGNTNETTSELEKRIEGFDKFQRKNNIVVNNVPEVQNDNVEVSKLMKNLGLENIDVNIIGRVGAKVEGKIWNLKFRVNNFEDKTQILTNSKKLRECEGYINIYVHSDLTRLQQVAGKNLRDELRRRKENRETNLRIKGGKIVSL